MSKMRRRSQMRRKKSPDFRTVRLLNEPRMVAQNSRFGRALRRRIRTAGKSSSMEIGIPQRPTAGFCGNDIHSAAGEPDFRFCAKSTCATEDQSSRACVDPNPTRQRGIVLLRLGSVSTNPSLTLRVMMNPNVFELLMSPGPETRIFKTAVSG